MAKMRNAPIYFALVQARFNALLTLEGYLPAIQDALRKTGYADFSKGLVININIGPPPAAGQIPLAQQITLFQFLNSAKTAGFILHQNALTLQTTEYETFSVFCDVFLKGLKIVSDAVGGLSFSERIGARFLDAVCPRENEKLSAYLVPALLGLSEHLNGRQLEQSMSETRSTLNKTNLVCRTVIKNQAETGAAFPQDLQPMILQVAEKFRNTKGLYAILDTDSFSEDRQKFDLENIRKTLDGLHADARRSFDAMVTPHALKVWGGE